MRIDGTVKTSMPEARRGPCAIDSAIPGSVLWACLDSGRTRIGFALPEEIWRAKGVNLAQEDIIRETEKAIMSFTLDFERVDW